MTEPREGLRSRKKRMTRELIADAALQLTLEKGLENVTSEEIASIAFVSPRTVSNYFSCKEEAVVAASSLLPELLQQYERSSPGDGPVQDLRRVVTAFFAAKTPEQLEGARQRLQLTEQHPSLRTFQMASYGQAERDLRDLIAERTGTEADRDLYPSLAAGAAISAVRTAVWVWAQSDAPADRLAELMVMAFDHFENGLSPAGAPAAVAGTQAAPDATGEAGESAATARSQADASATRIADATARAVATIASDLAPGRDRRGALTALQVAATTEARAVTSAEGGTAEAAPVTAAASAASDVASSAPDVDKAIEDEVARVAAALRTTATAIARRVASETHARAADAALIARGAAAAAAASVLDVTGVGGQSEGPAADTDDRELALAGPSVAVPFSADATS